MQLFEQCSKRTYFLSKCAIIAEICIVRASSLMILVIMHMDGRDHPCWWLKWCSCLMQCDVAILICFRATYWKSLQNDSMLASLSFCSLDLDDNGVDVDGRFNAILAPWQWEVMLTLTWFLWRNMNKTRVKKTVASKTTAVKQNSIKKLDWKKMSNSKTSSTSFSKSSL